MGDLAGWVVGAGTVVSVLALLYSRKDRRQDVKVREQSEWEKQMDAKLRPVMDTLESFRKYHNVHFAARARLENTMVGLEQRMADQEKHYEERFTRIEEMHKEIRSDIKELMKRIPS